MRRQNANFETQKVITTLEISLSLLIKVMPRDIVNIIEGYCRGSKALYQAWVEYLVENTLKDLLVGVDALKIKDAKSSIVQCLTFQFGFDFNNFCLGFSLHGCQTEIQARAATLEWRISMALFQRGIGVVKHPKSFSSSPYVGKIRNTPVIDKTATKISCGNDIFNLAMPEAQRVWKNCSTIVIALIDYRNQEICPVTFDLVPPKNIMHVKGNMWIPDLKNKIMEHFRVNPSEKDKFVLRTAHKVDGVPHLSYKFNFLSMNYFLYETSVKDRDCIYLSNA